MSSALVQRDREGLLRVLERVDVEGWDGPVARELLAEVRRIVVAPLVAQVGLRGVAAEQASSTGWAVAWEVLRAPSTRAATSPWGVVWVAVRRAILNEHLAAAYATSPRTAWRLATADGDSPSRPVSLDALRAIGWEPQEPAYPVGAGIIRVVVDLMIEAGWSRALAEDVMEAIAQAAPWGPGSGWRWVANRVEAEPWQVRRLVDVVVGSDGGPNAAVLAQRPQDQALRADFVGRLRRTMSRRGTCTLVKAS